MEPIGTTQRTKTLTDHTLMKSPEKDLHRVVIEMGLFDLEFIYCSRKTSLLNFKNDADKTSVDKLRSVRFSDYSDHICVNDAYEDFTN